MLDHRQQGFIAQELYKYYPDAVVVGGDNVFLDPWLVDYGRLTPLLAKAIQDLNLKLEDLATAPVGTSTPLESQGPLTGQAASTTPTTFASQFFQNLFTRITAWLADAANGIANIISDTLTAREKLCVGDTCVTPEQFRAVFGNQNAAAGTPPIEKRSAERRTRTGSHSSNGHRHNYHIIGSCTNCTNHKYNSANSRRRFPNRTK